MKLSLTITKATRGYHITAGNSILGKFRTKELAQTSLIEDAEMYLYWAGSASTSVENTTPNYVKLSSRKEVQEVTQKPNQHVLFT